MGLTFFSSIHFHNLNTYLVLNNENPQKIQKRKRGKKKIIKKRQEIKHKKKGAASIKFTYTHTCTPFIHTTANRGSTQIF